VVLVLALIRGVQIFDEAFVLTGGGPGTATETLTFYAYVAGFRTYNLNFTSTVAWALVILMTIIFTIYLRVFRRIDSQEV